MLSQLCFANLAVCLLSLISPPKNVTHVDSVTFHSFPIRLCLCHPVQSAVPVLTPVCHYQLPQYISLSGSLTRHQNVFRSHARHFSAFPWTDFEPAGLWHSLLASALVNDPVFCPWSRVLSVPLPIVCPWLCFHVWKKMLTSASCLSTLSTLSVTTHLASPYPLASRSFFNPQLTVSLLLVISAPLLAYPVLDLLLCRHNNKNRNNGIHAAFPVVSIWLFITQSMT